MRIEDIFRVLERFQGGSRRYDGSLAFIGVTWGGICKVLGVYWSSGDDLKKKDSLGIAWSFGNRNSGGWHFCQRFNNWSLVLK